MNADTAEQLMAAIEEQDRIIAENEAQIQEEQARAETLGDELELSRAKYRDQQVQYEELQEQLGQVNTLWRDRARGHQIRDRNATLQETQEQMEGQTSDKAQRLSALEAEVHQLKLEYEQERQSRIDMCQQLGEVTNNLLTYLQKRSEDGMSERREPLKALKRLKEIEKERERDLQSSVRELRELEAVVMMKTRRVQELQDHAKKEVVVATASKDDEMGKLRFEIDDERQRILNEIKELERANKEQAYNLKRGATPSAKEGSMTIAKRAAVPKDEPRRNAAQRLLESKNKQLRAEKEALAEQLAATTQDRNDWIKKIKLEKQRLEKENRSYGQELTRLDNEITRGRKLMERQAHSGSSPSDSRSDTVSARTGTSYSTSNHP